MYSVLIVDDELFIRERLRTMIPWQEYGLEVVGLAEDGETALQLMALKKPDIVITDVKMPDMTGLEMIGKLKERGENAHFIILSAYGEFEYARQALQLGVTDYLLKPTQPDELLVVVMKLVDLLDASRQQQRRDMRVLSYRDSIRSQYIQELILGQHPGYGWEEECVNVGIEWLLKGNLRLLLVSMEGSGNRHDLEAIKTAQFAVQNVMYEIISAKNDICPVRLSVGRWLIVVGAISSVEQLISSTHNLRDAIARYTKQNVHIMISEPVEHALDLGRLFWETEKTMDYMGEDVDKPIRLIDSSDRGPTYRQWSKPMNELIHWIADAQTEKVVQWLNQLKASFLSWELQSTKRWCFEWLLTLREHALLDDADRVEAWSDTDDLRMRIESLTKNKDLLQFFSHEVHRMIRQRHCKGPHQLIRKAIGIIEKNFDQDIQLTTIAEELSMSPVYLSEFFKLQTGVTFRNFLLQVRMAEAIRLLKDPRVKVYEVAYRVGYSKVEHFVKLFKKQYGMTPSEYRGALV